MGFIENLRQRLAAEAQTRQQREESIRLAKEAEKVASIQMLSKEAAILAERRTQAQAYWQESEVGILLDNLLGCFKMDNSIYWSGKEHLWPNEKPDIPDPARDFVGEWPSSGPFVTTSREKRGLVEKMDAVIPYGQGPNSGSVCEGLWYSHGKGKIVKDYSSREAIRSGQGINRIMHNFYNYICVEITHDGNITLYSGIRKSIPRSTWKDNRDILETMLGEAYGKPGIFIIEEQQWTHGPRSAGTG